MVKAKVDDPLLRQVLDVGKGRGRRSTLYAWMRDHHAILTAEFDANGPRWSERSKAMGDAGLTDGAGKPPTIRTVMQTWYRVCLEMERQAGRVKRTEPPLSPVPTLRQTATTAAVPDNAPAPDLHDDDEFIIVGGTGISLNPKKPK